MNLSEHSSDQDVYDEMKYKETSENYLDDSKTNCQCQCECHDKKEMDDDGDHCKNCG